MKQYGINSTRFFCRYIKNLFLLQLLIYIGLAHNEYNFFTWMAIFLLLNLVMAAYYFYGLKSGNYDLTDEKKLSQYISYEEKFSLIGWLKIILTMEIIVVSAIAMISLGYYLDHSKFPETDNIIKGIYTLQILPFYYFCEGVYFRIMKKFNVSYTD